MCVSEYEHQVPYGVIRLNGHQILEIQEKPRQKFLINAGIYVLDPDVLNLLGENEYIDMTSLIERVARENWETAVFPLREYWLDVGRHADLDKANAEFKVAFG
jgi:NDP-sugar pyrophosphorylase family protein